jgi:hypothetical protein
MRRRLADRPTQRWLWSAASSLPVLGLPLLLWHGVRCRTVTPFLYGLTTQAIGAFLLATITSSLWSPPGPAPGDGSRQGAAAGHGAMPLALVLAASACFALGHRQGQERAARDAATWLRLDD